MHHRRWVWLGCGAAAALAVGLWTPAHTDPSPVPLITHAESEPWTGPPAESAPWWPELVLPLLALGVAVVAHTRWRARRHRRQVHGLQEDMEDGLEAQSQLLTLADLLPVGISHVEEDAEGQLLARFVNPRMAELLGVRLDDLQFDAKAGWRHVHPDDLRRANVALSQAADSVRKGAPQVDVETLCRVQRGERTRWLRTHARLSLAAGAAGRQGVVHIHACAQDVTESRRQQKFSQDVLDGFPAPVRIRDLAGRHLLTNPAFDRLHQLATGEALGKTDADLLPADLQHLYRTVDERLIASDTPQVFEQTVAGPGGPRALQVTQFWLRDEDQRPYASCAISTDVSSYQMALGQQQRLLDAAPLPALIACAGRVVYANRRCTDLLGGDIARDEAHPVVDPVVMQRLETRVAQEGHVTTHRLRLRDALAQPHDLWMTAVPACHNGQPAILMWLELPPGANTGAAPRGRRAADRPAG